MFDTRWYKIFYDLSGNLTRSILIILSITVGLFAVGTILSAREILSTDLARSYATINPSNGVVRTMELFDEDFVQAIRSVKGVEEVDARRLINVRARVGNGNWSDITLFVVDDYDKMKVNKILPEEGAWPPPDRQVLIERSAMSVIDGKIGDDLMIELPNDQKRVLPISGTVHDMAQVPAQIDETPYGYINFKTADSLGLGYGFNELDIVAADQSNASAANNLINRVKNKAERNGFTIPLSMTAEPGQLPLNDVLQAILILMAILGVLSLFLSVFLIINTVSSILAQQRRQIGVMKAVGANSLQIIKMYMGMVLIFGIIALVISIPLSAMGAGLLSRLMATMFNFDIEEVHITLLAVVVQLVTGLLIPIAASLYPFLANLRVTAAEALRGNQAGSQKTTKDIINRLISGARLWFARRFLVRPLLLSLRNTFRSKGRLVLTLITLSLAGAIFISVFNVRASIFSTMDLLMKQFNFDVFINFEQRYAVKKIELETYKNPQVDSMDVWMLLPARVVRTDDTESKVVYMYTPRADSPLFLSPEILAGRWLVSQDDNALVVNSIFLKDENLSLGDEVTLKIDGSKYPFKIVGVTMGFATSFIYGNYPYVARVIDATGKADMAMVSFNKLSGGDLTQAVESLEDHYKQQGLHVTGEQTMIDEKNQAEAMFDSIILLLMLMAALLAVVGGLGLMGTMSINVLERTREIGILRAIGAPNWGVSSVFIQEGIAIGLISWVFGLIASIPFSLLMDYGVGQPIVGAALQFKYSYEGGIIWLIIIILISALASLVPARNASRLTVREVLAYE